MTDTPPKKFSLPADKGAVFIEDNDASPPDDGGAARRKISDQLTALMGDKIIGQPSFQTTGAASLHSHSKGLPQAFVASGASGIGKTALAEKMMKEIMGHGKSQPPAPSKMVEAEVRTCHTGTKKPITPTKRGQLRPKTPRR